MVACCYPGQEVLGGTSAATRSFAEILQETLFELTAASPPRFAGRIEDRALHGEPPQGEPCGRRSRQLKEDNHVFSTRS